MDIKCRVNFNYSVGAAEECKACLHFLGFRYVSIKKQRGSHGAEIWIPDEDKERFEKEILGNTLIGERRRFFFSHPCDLCGHPSIYYYVSYQQR
jgi:hypothetical protein